MVIVGYIILILAIYYFITYFFAEEKKDVAYILRRDLEKKKGGQWVFLLRGLVPINLILMRGIFKVYAKGLAEKIIILKWSVKPEEFFSTKLFGVIGLPLFFYAGGVTGGGVLAFVALIGFIIPDIILNSKVRKLKEEIVRLMPEVVDLLALCVGAGLNFVMAMKWVIEKSRGGPLIDQFRTVLEEINVGKSRIEALRNMSQRLRLPDVTSFTRILIQADRLGTPVEEAFQIVSDDMRMRRFHRGERQALKAPMKMLIPLIFCILPVIMIIIGGPILLRFMGGGLMGK